MIVPPSLRAGQILEARAFGPDSVVSANPSTSLTAGAGPAGSSLFMNKKGGGQHVKKPRDLRVKGLLIPAAPWGPSKEAAPRARGPQLASSAGSGDSLSLSPFFSKPCLQGPQPAPPRALASDPRGAPAAGGQGPTPSLAFDLRPYLLAPAGFQGHG